MTALGFKARIDPPHLYFLGYMHWIPQIPLWCDTCWSFDSQHDNQVILIHMLAHVSTSIGGLEPMIEHAAAQRANRKPLGFSGDNIIICMCKI